MSDAVEDRQVRREIRGRILRTLDLFYGRTPPNCTMATIRRSLGAVPQAEIDQAMQYLIDLSYAARIEDKRDALDVDPLILFRLMALGKKVLNGDIEDRSIEV